MTEENTTISQTKLFVGGLNWTIRGRELKEFFEQYGEVIFARVKLDKDTGKSRGFGFVEFVNAEDAKKAQVAVDGQEIKGRAVKVDFAKENPDRLNKIEKTEEIIE
ncbi:MAG: hypothetical protein WC872_04700 [Candidatus Absconditabacterales bacterium]